MGLYENIKYLASRKGMTIPEFAEEIGVGKTSIYKWKDQNPSFDVVLQVAAYFGVTVEYLVSGSDSPDWATNDDLYDLEEMLNNGVNMAYGGEELTDEEKQRVRDILTGIFWEKKAKQNGKKKYNNDLPDI